MKMYCIVAPARERGLKYRERRAHTTAEPVAPARERGLKYRDSKARNRKDTEVAPARERGLKCL